MNIFLKYICLEVLVWIYLGCWNVTVPLVIVKQGGLGELAIYETSLALVAVVAMLCLASRVEAMRRTTALELASAAVVASSLLRYFYISVSYSLAPLIAIDVLAVAAFGVIQSLLGVYPAEVVGKDRVEFAFRIRRIAMTLSRVAAPLLAGLVIGLSSTHVSLLLSAILGIGVFGISVALPASSDPKVPVREKTTQRIQDMFSGLTLKFTLPPERFLTITGVLLSLATASTLPLLVPAAVHSYGLGEGQMGLLSAIFAIGSVGGLIFFSPVIAKKNNQRSKFAVLWLVLTLALTASAYSRTLWALAVSLLIVGAASACLSLIGMDKRMLSVPPGLRIRLTAATLVVGQLANSTSYLMTGATVARFGYQGLSLLYVGILAIALSCAVMSTMVWRFLEDNGDSELFYENHYPKLMKNMPG